MLKDLRQYYAQKGLNVEVLEGIPFNGFAIIRCREWNPVGEPWTYFDLIEKDGKFYNCNFDEMD